VLLLSVNQSRHQGQAKALAKAALNPVLHNPPCVAAKRLAQRAIYARGSWRVMSPEAAHASQHDPQPPTPYN
jgi:hypothetical protein